MSSAGGPGGVAPRPCRSCREPVYDLLYVRTGKTAPIEVRLSSNGNVLVDLEAGIYKILSGLALEAARLNGSALRVNHFMACPQAASWHAKKGTRL